MDPNSKSIFTSVTFWGIALGLLSQVASRLGWYFPGDITGLANDISGVAGALIGIWGRISATQAVHLISPGNQSGRADIRFLVAVAAISIAACAVTPQTPAQDVYAIQGDYAAALSVAVAYKQLPACGQPTSPVLCSDKAVVAKLQAADDAAYAALTAAQNIVRTPGAGLNAQTAITAANQAVQALITITSTLGVK